MTEIRYSAALDIGGTKILAGIFAEGKLIARKRIETQAAKGAQAVISRASELIRALAHEVHVSLDMLAGVGCSVPGPLDNKSGVVILSPNLAWRNVPLARMLEEQLSVPVEIEDDARCAALGEVRRGAARGLQHAVYVTISTGIGGGVILNGSIYRGAHGCAGEVGHITLEADGPPCGCGNVGCFESLASGTAIAMRARQAVLHGDETMLSHYSDNLSALHAEQVVQAAEAGDEVALRILATAGSYLGLGLAAIATMFDPQAIVLGGGVIRPDGLLLQHARRMFEARVIQPLGQLVRILPAELGDESSLWGAAMLVTER